MTKPNKKTASKLLEIGLVGGGFLTGFTAAIVGVIGPTICAFIVFHPSFPILTGFCTAIVSTILLPYVALSSGSAGALLGISAHGIITTAATFISRRFKTTEKANSSERQPFLEPSSPSINQTTTTLLQRLGGIRTKVTEVTKKGTYPIRHPQKTIRTGFKIAKSPQRTVRNIFGRYSS